jgi:hypothetical protein
MYAPSPLAAVMIHFASVKHAYPRCSKSSPFRTCVYGLIHLQDVDRRGHELGACTPPKTLVQISPSPAQCPSPPEEQYLCGTNPSCPETRLSRAHRGGAVMIVGFAGHAVGGSASRLIHAVARLTMTSIAFWSWSSESTRRRNMWSSRKI